MTQELIANMFDVRHGGRRLQQNVCEHYAVINNEFNRLLAEIPPGMTFQYVK